jgi:hypothetical protein
MIPRSVGVLVKRGISTMQKRYKPANGWARLDEHFGIHAAAVERFRGAGRRDVRRMWRAGTNERGEPLTRFEREALVERHCELFGRWPKDWQTAPARKLSTTKRRRGQRRGGLLQLRS